MRCLSSIAVIVAFVGCHETGGSLDTADPIAADEAEAAAGDLDKWDGLVEYFDVPAAFGFWYIGDGSDLSEANDYCSVAYAEKLASDPWAIDSQVSNEELTIESYILNHMWPMLRSARAARIANGDDADEVDSYVESLRRLLVRAAFRAQEIRRVGESDRFGGYRCIEIITSDGVFMMAKGGWS